MRLPTLALVLLLPAAAPAGEPSRPPPLAHRSSIAAVLAQAGALKLTPEQVKSLEQADATLMKEQQAARTAAATPPEDAKGGDGGGAGPKSAGAGGKSRPPPPKRGAPDPEEILNQQLDILDSEAFLKAVEGMPEAQREKAIEIASRYREQVFEQREREKAR